MFAVAAYLAPRGTAFKTWNMVATASFNLVRPYVLITSQWQKWDIFSPDPLRRVSTYVVDVADGDGWSTLRTIEYGTLAWHERPRELKILGRLEENWNGLTPGFLLQECKAFPEAAGRTVRLRAASYAIPKDLSSLSRLSATKLRVTERILGEAACPPSA